MKKMIPASVGNRRTPVGEAAGSRNLVRLLQVYSLLILTALTSWAQTASREISGTVVNAVTNDPLPGVNILEKGTNNGTITDVNGTFRISVKEKATLVVSFIGFATQEIVTGAASNLSVRLEEDNRQLGELTVIGYGTQKSTQVTSSISKIKAGDLNERPLSRVDHAMAGKLAGVQVQEVSGAPGRGLAVKVRGVGSINNSTAPLHVVDGYPLNGGIDQINPNDIESIEVLKDAASAAIYGSRGSNGVVLITTKTGKSGKPVLQLDAYYGVQERFSKVDVLNRDEYIEFAIEERNNTWVL